MIKVEILSPKYFLFSTSFWESSITAYKIAQRSPRGLDCTLATSLRQFDRLQCCIGVMAAVLKLPSRASIHLRSIE